MATVGTCSGTTTALATCTGTTVTLATCAGDTQLTTP